MCFCFLNHNKKTTFEIANNTDLSVVALSDILIFMKRIITFKGNKLLDKTNEMFSNEHFRL